MFVSIASGVEPQPPVRAHPLAQPAGVCVVVGEPVDVVSQGVQRARGDDAGLAHAAAEELAVSAREAMNSAEPTTADPTGAPRPFEKQTEAESTGAATSAGLRPLATAAFQIRAPSRCTRMPCAWAKSASSARPLGREHAPARLADRVLEAEQALEGVVDVGRVAQPHRDRVDVEHAVLAGQEPGLDAGERRGAALLVDDDVGQLVHEDLVAGPCVGADRDLVSHRPRRDVDGRLLAEHPGDLGLELDHGRVVAPDVVADLGLGHGLAHRRRRPGDGVGAKVDDRASRGAYRSGMALEMRTRCERCDAALDHGGEARICSYECTFCPACAAAMAAVCPNCGGELVARPRRAEPLDGRSVSPRRPGPRGPSLARTCERAGEALRLRTFASPRPRSQPIPNRHEPTCVLATLGSRRSGHRERYRSTI